MTISHFPSLLLFNKAVDKSQPTNWCQFQTRKLSLNSTLHATAHELYQDPQEGSASLIDFRLLRLLSEGAAADFLLGYPAGASVLRFDERLPRFLRERGAVAYSGSLLRSLATWGRASSRPRLRAVG